MKNKNFEWELPEGYEPVGVVDAKNKKTVILMNVTNLVIVLAIILTGFFLIRPLAYPNGYSYVKLLVFLVSMIAYIVLHELVHGVAYKLTTGEKLTFGMTLSVAYCGVPNIYVYRKAAMIALLAPFAVFTVVFGLLILFLTDPWSRFYTVMLFAIHVGGCVGDLYDTILYLFKYRDPTTLMRDTGPKQTFYLKK